MQKCLVPRAAQRFCRFFGVWSPLWTAGNFQNASVPAPTVAPTTRQGPRRSFLSTRGGYPAGAGVSESGILRVNRCFSPIAFR